MNKPIDPAKLEWADYAVQAQCGNLKELTHANLGKWPELSQLVAPLWTDTGLKTRAGID